MYDEKNHEFIYHYHQVGGRAVSEQLPVNILKLGPIKQYTINFDQQEKFYDFFDAVVVDVFLKSVRDRFSPDGD